MVSANYGFNIMTSVYKQDFGNGLVIYADDYVKTGKWVYDCNNSRLIRREPLLFPVLVLEEVGRLTIDDDMYLLADIDRAHAKIAIKAITGIRNWHRGLRYLYSGLNESSELKAHIFDLLAQHNNRKWAVKVTQLIDSKNTSTFEITAEPYDPETYMDYDRVLQAAAMSCSVPQ